MDNLEDRRIELERAAFIAGEEVATKRIIAALREPSIEMADAVAVAMKDDSQATWSPRMRVLRAVADCLERESAAKAT